MSTFISRLPAAQGLGATDLYVVDQLISGAFSTRQTPFSALIAAVQAAIVTAITFAWRTSAVSTQVAVGDLNNGIMLSGSGAMTLTVPSDATLNSLPTLPGSSVLVYLSGSGTLVITGSGATVNVRTGFLSQAAGQSAVLTLIHTPLANDWVLCGDMHL